MNTSILINATRAGKTVKKTVTNINPDKSNADLKTFAQMVNALSADTFAGGNRINVQSLDESSDSRIDPVITFTGNFSMVVDDNQNLLYLAAPFTCNTDGTIAATTSKPMKLYSSVVMLETGSYQIRIKGYEDGDLPFNIAFVTQQTNTCNSIQHITNVG